jgi:hypothetical protein
MDYEDWLYIGGSDMGIVEYDPVNEPYQVEVQSAACVVGLVENLTEVDYANARLIAAAPDLLKACEAAMRAFDDPDPISYQRASAKCAAAVAKAKGD